MKDRYSLWSRWKEARKSVGFVATRVAGTIECFLTARFRRRVDPFWVAITLNSDAAIQLVAQSQSVPEDRQAPHLIGRPPEMLCRKWQTQKIPATLTTSHATDALRCALKTLLLSGMDNLGRASS